ncbi:Mannosyl transferase [Pyrenophora teres f. maculata]|nr:Mannosyl transferase [Pyrenophora teres f. maculata]
MSATRQKARPPVNNAAGRPQLPPTAAFCVFALANLVAAVFSPIQDCDEVFNYWEPSHYLNHGHGLQTWEYSPDYAIRSWAYTGIHSLVMWAGTLPIQPLALRASKVLEFYFLRMVLAVACAVCQTRMYSAIRTTFQERIAIFFMMIMVISPGMYHAAPAYLPSSFAMYFAMLGFASFMDWYGGLIRTAQGITWFAVGSALGWPFAGALALPFILEDVIVGFVTSTLQESLRRLLFQGATRAFAILALQTAIDSFFYRKLVCVPLNIVLYNVFSGGSRGPDIYGVEPWHFYVRNLALNFNIWFFLALAALPLLLIQHLVFDKSVSKHTLRRSVVFVSPFYLWLAIFTVQPHKEERFMYPAYPALAWNAALSLHIILANFGSNDPRHLVSKIPPSVKLVIVCIPLLLSFNLGMLRTVGHMTAYSAPLAIYKPLLHSTIAHPGTNVCLGKEWYRFPSSFNLPHGVHAKFIKSEFSGLLPGEFSTATDTADGFFPGTHVVPPGMNDENLEDVGKYIDVQHCDFLVDSRIPGQEPTALEPDYAADTQHWETVKCIPFLAAGQTNILGRMLWVPDSPLIPAKLQRKWGDYCLLKQRRTAGGKEDRA